MFQQYTLKNKANVVLVPQNDTQSVTVLVMYPVGSRYEPEKLAGVSHYIEHLMFKGTKKRATTQILTREIDRLGAEYNAFTGKEYTGYYIKTDAAYSEITLDILSDMLNNSVFDPKEMEREKGPIVEELRMYKDNPMMNIDNIFEDLMFAGCPLGRDIGGTPKHVMSYKRPEVLKYRNKYYTPSSMTIVVAGKIGNEIENKVKNYFGKKKSANKLSASFKPYCFGPSAKAKRIVVEKKHTDQVQLMLGFPGFKYGASQNAAIGAMNTILGGSMSSRLFIEIRERRGLAYHVRSGDEQYRDIGYVYVRVGLEAKNINKAIEVIKKEIEKICTKGVTKRELADAKTHIRGGLTLTMEDSSVQANYFARQALFAKKIETPEQKLKKIEKVTRQQVRDVAQRVFDWKKVRVAAIGDVDSEAVRF
jgi:predicted Zn-dependent peptidase